jgi:hypothetical protein
MAAAPAEISEELTWKVVDVTYEDAPVTETMATRVEPQPTFTTIADLLNAGWTAEQIVAANEGVIPSTSEDCQRVAEKLQAEGQDAALQK